MESTQGKMRAKLVLGHAIVTDKGNDWFKIHIGGSTTITITPPSMDMFDVRIGDRLALYTEVYFAQPSSPSIQ